MNRRKSFVHLVDTRHSMAAMDEMGRADDMINSHESGRNTPNTTLLLPRNESVLASRLRRKR